MPAIPTIPGYTIEKELGQGGMARVYLAHEEKLALAAYRTLTENLYMSAEEVARRRRRTNRDAIVFALILVGLVIGIIVLVAYLAK